MTHLPYIVIGDGIAARTLIFYLSQYHSDIPVLQFSKEEIYPSCSRRTTSVNSLRGTRKGVSELGDLIVNSYEEFEKFYNKFTPDGVVKTNEFAICDEKSSEYAKWQKRYTDNASYTNALPVFQNSLTSSYWVARNDAYIISQYTYLDWLGNTSKTKRIYENVIEIVGRRVKTLTGEYEGRKIFICAGIWNRNFLYLVQDEKLRKRLEHSKPVAGTYCEIAINNISNKNLNLEQSWAISIDGINIIYRCSDKKILIGATTENMSEVLLPNRQLFSAVYERAIAFLNPLAEFPPYKEVELFCGIREKGQKRLPFWGEIAPDTFMVSALYKNAFTLANLAASELSK